MDSELIERLEHLADHIGDNDYAIPLMSKSAVLEAVNVVKLAKAWHHAQSIWNTAMDDRNPDMADAADAEIAKAQGELYTLMDALHKGK